MTREDRARPAAQQESREAQAGRKKSRAGSEKRASLGQPAQRARCEKHRTNKRETKGERAGAGTFNVLRSTCCLLSSAFYVYHPNYQITRLLDYQISASTLLRHEPVVDPDQFLLGTEFDLNPASLAAADDADARADCET